MIEDKPLTNLELEKVTSRRSRKDEEGRDFLCGCGKRYLSYPALYTHIKTKHDGRQPEGTQKTGINLMSKRIKGNKAEEQSHCTIANYVQKCDVKLLGALDKNQNYQGTVCLSSRFKKQSLPKDLYQCYNNLSKHQEIILTKTSSLDSALVVYLYGVGDCVNQKLYPHYLLFSKLARNCFYEHGEQVYKACFNKKQGLGVIQHFTISQVQYFPIICDFLMRYYIPYSESNKQLQSINLSLMQLMLSDFCDWLFKKQLTLVKVSLKKEYRLELKLVPIEHKKEVTENNGKVKDNEQVQEDSFSESSNKNPEYGSLNGSEAHENGSNSDESIVEQEEPEEMADFVAKNEVEVNQQKKEVDGL